MGMMDRRKQIIKKEQQRHFLCGELLWENHLSAADAALENSYQHWCEGLMDSKSFLKSMSSGVLGGSNDCWNPTAHLEPHAPRIKTFLHGSHFCLKMEIKMSK